jgi:putative ABC transport system permease protein
MTRLALKALAARKLRSALSTFAIVLGVAMVTGSFVLTDTISKAFGTIFTGAYEHTDAVVSGRPLVDWSTSGNPTVSERTLAAVRSHPDVAAAAGTIIDLTGNATMARLIDREGNVISASGNPTFGFGIDSRHEQFNPLRLADGRWPRGLGEVVIDRESASGHGFRAGDTIRVAANGPVRTFRVSGTAQFGDVSTLGGATFAVWDIPTARRMLGLSGYTTVSASAREGIDDEELVRALRSVVPENAVLRTGKEQSEHDEQAIAAFITFLQGMLLAFGGIALLVGSFVIFNTLSITVAQRTRELATLRSLGASRRQVRRLVVAEAVALGVVASTLGIGLGIGLARGLSAFFSAIGLALPESEPVYAPRTFVVALVVGVVVTLLAALGPARRATRVAPIAAIREASEHVRGGLRSVTVGAFLLASGIALVGYATFGGDPGASRSLLALAGGMLAGLIGLAGISRALVGPVVRVIGAPSRRLAGAAGRLASDNATRNPARTARTAAALMIGLTLVTFVSILAAGVKRSYAGGLEQQIGADYVITSDNGWAPFPAAAGDAAARAAGVTAASSIRGDRGLVGNVEANVSSVDPATLGDLFRLEWTAGSDESLRRLGTSGAIVKQAFARANGLEVGDTFALRAPDGSSARFSVEAMYQPPRVAEMLGGIIVSQTAFDALFPRPQNSLTLVRGGSIASLERALSRFLDTRVQTRDRYIESQASFLDSFTNMLVVLLGLSVLVSVFGMVNALVLSVWERTRELGMLRAVGMSRRQTRRMIRHESVTIALIGAGLGLPLGTLLAAAVTHALGEYGVSFVIPVTPLVMFTLAAIVCGILAAVGPARRAARLDVIKALQYE